MNISYEHVFSAVGGENAYLLSPAFTRFLLSMAGEYYRFVDLSGQVVELSDSERQIIESGVAALTEPMEETFMPKLVWRGNLPNGQVVVHSTGTKISWNELIVDSDYAEWESQTARVILQPGLYLISFVARVASPAGPWRHLARIERDSGISIDATDTIRTGSGTETVSVMSVLLRTVETPIAANYLQQSGFSVEVTPSFSKLEVIRLS